MVTLKINIEGVEHKFDTIAKNASDLKTPLRKFGAHLRNRAIERYKAQDFAPLAPATLAKRAQKGLKGLEKKLSYSLKKALITPTVKESTRERRAALLAEFQNRRKREKSAIVPHKVALSFKQMLSLGTRMDKAIAKAISAPILGKLVKSLKITVDKGSVTLASRTKENWSGAHNEGDGHVPQRETVKVDSDDLKVFADILKEHMLLDVSKE